MIDVVARQDYQELSRYTFDSLEIQLADQSQTDGHSHNTEGVRESTGWSCRNSRLVQSRNDRPVWCARNGERWESEENDLAVPGSGKPQGLLDTDPRAQYATLVAGLASVSTASQPAAFSAFAGPVKHVG